MSGKNPAVLQSADRGIVLICIVDGAISVFRQIVVAAANGRRIRGEIVAKIATGKSNRCQRRHTEQCYQ